MATQPAVADMSDQELEQHAFSILSRELGLAGYARFLRLFGSGRDDYTAERREWQKDITLEQILADIKGRRDRNEIKAA